MLHAPVIWCSRDAKYPESFYLSSIPTSTPFSGKHLKVYKTALVVYLNRMHVTSEMGNHFLADLYAYPFCRI